MFQSQPFGILLRAVLTVILVLTADLASAATNIVTSIADDNSLGTLRYWITNSAVGDTITFSPGLSGATILLTNASFQYAGALVVGKSLTIDASSLPGGIQINGNHNGSVFFLGGGSTNTFIGLTITNGYALGTGFFGNGLQGDGGGIINGAVLTLNRCTVVGNSALIYGGASGIPPGHGGAGIANFGPMTLNECTIAGNNLISGSGAGIFNDGTLIVNRSTISGNFGNSAIANGRTCFFCGPLPGGRVTVNQSTITGSNGGISSVSTNAVIINQSTLSGTGAAISGAFFITNSIIAGTASSPQNNSVSSLFVTDANLSPLGFYGGPTQTMPPLLSSPAIDAGSDTATNLFATDQRGLPRFYGLHVDIGAVESSYPPSAPLAITQPASGIDYAVATLNATVAPNGAVATSFFQYGTTTNYGTTTTNVTVPAVATAISTTPAGLLPATTYHFRIVATNSLGTTFGDDFSFRTGGLQKFVTNTNDSGPGSLRDAVQGFVAGDSTNIVFATNLSGSTILLTSGPITLNNSFNLDVSPLPGGLTVDGNSNGPVFSVLSGSNVFTSLRIIHGKVVGLGGGIQNSATLTLNKCTVAECIATGTPGNGWGGAIANDGSLTINQSTLSSNSASYGGAIYNERGMVLNRCTLFGNSASSMGGGLWTLSGSATFNQCTLSGNSATDGGAIATAGQRIYGFVNLNQTTISGNYGTNSGGIRVDYIEHLAMANSIVAGNTSSSSLNILVIDDNSTTLVDWPGCLTNGNPMLAPLGDYGGSTLTMPPLLGSPAIDIGNDSLAGAFATDQRGSPRLAGLHVDSGAVESDFPPAAPLVITQPATAAGLTVATLNATVNPNRAATAAWFQYGTTTNYGAVTASTPLNAGTAPITNLLTGLPPRTTYHFRAVGSNAFGTAFGNDLSFTTAGFTNLVSNTNDSGPGSLRDAAVANFRPGDSILFATNLSGKTILLTSGEIVLSGSLSLDASGLLGRLTIDGNTNGRILTVTNNITVVLDSLILTHGKTTNSGGAVLNLGTLTLNKCIVAGNASASAGGGIYNDYQRNLTLNQCTLTGNASGNWGGAIYSSGPLTVNQSTLSSNSAAASGGGIYQEAAPPLALNQSTLTANTANGGGGIYVGTAAVINQCTISGNNAVFGGGGIQYSTSSMAITNCIVAGNTGTNKPDFRIDSIPHNPIFGGANLTNSNPMLAPLGNYGGPTLTMPPLPGSPAIDACTNGTIFIMDQRGFPRVADGNGDSIAVADIGAVEGTNAPDGPGILTGARKTGGSIQFEFANVTGRSFTVFSSTNVSAPINTWTPIGSTIESPAGSGQYQFTDPSAANDPQRFYRVRSP